MSVFREIAMHSGHIAYVDNQDFALVSQYKWRTRKANNKKFYVITTLNDSIVRMHRLILGLSSNDKSVVDHINGNSLDNRRNNLRICSIKENCRNREKNRTIKVRYTSKYKGVSFCARTKRWMAQIVFNSRSYFLGRFDTEILAAQAYNNAAKEKFGIFSRFNLLEDSK